VEFISIQSLQEVFPDKEDDSCKVKKPHPVPLLAKERARERF